MVFRATRLFALLSLTVGLPTKLLAQDVKSFPWQSAGHLGLVVNSESSTQFKDSIGAATFFDITGAVSEKAAAGFRTMTIDSHRPGGSYYRLAAGPLFQVSAFENWLFHAFIGAFSESAESGGNAPLYRSKGLQTLLSWERVYELHERMDFAWGGFWGYHSGSVELSKDVLLAGSGSHTFSHNRGQTRGLEFSLRIRL